MFFIISWLLVGFLTTLVLVIYDLRNEKYDDTYFDDDTLLSSIIFIVLGFATPIICISFFIHKYCTNKFKDKNLRRLLYKVAYKIANVGVKNGAHLRYYNFRWWPCGIFCRALYRTC